MSSDELVMVYMPIAGRGELIRLIAAAGGITLNETKDLAAGETKSDYVSPSGTPLLKHGDLKLSQSGAIEAYVANIAPKFSGLTVQQRAIDSMYAGIKEEILTNCGKAIFTTKSGDDVTKLLDDKWFPLMEANLPADGFINGLAFPTVADLAVLNITTGYMPFGAAMKLAGFDTTLGKYPKVKALVDRTAAALGPEVFPNKFTNANPFK